MLERQW